MKTTSEKMENCQMSLNVEMETAETEKYMATALENLGKKVTLPGFRQGKAPSVLVEQYVGKDAILKEALEHIIPEAYEQALKIESISAIAEPKIELIQTDPIVFKATVPLQPNVLPGDYKSVRMEMDKKEVTEAEVDLIIEEFRDQHSILDVVDRPVQFEDTIEIDIHCKQGERTLLNRQDAEYAVHEGHKYPAPGFAEKLIGLKKGEETEFTLSFPEDYHIKEVAGNQYDFKVKIKEVKGKALPELNDEFAKTVGSDNVVTLRESIKTRLQKHTDDGLKKEFANKLLAKLVEQSTIEFPPVLVENEINRILKEESQKFPDGLTGLQNSLVNLNKTLEQHREDLRPTAVNRVKGYLVASKIAELENVAVADEEVDGMVDTMSTGEDGTDEKLKALFNLPQSRASLRDMLYINKAMILLTKIATGQDTQ